MKKYVVLTRGTICSPCVVYYDLYIEEDIPMSKKNLYIWKKILAMMFTLIVVSFCVFAAFEIIPGDPVTGMLGTDATPKRIAELKADYGLDRPFLLRYFSWVKGCLNLDFGLSYSYHTPVSEIINEKLPVTFVMAIISFLITIIVSIPVGVEMAKHVGSKTDKVLYGANQFIMAIPQFFLGLIFTYVFGVVLKLFVPGGYISYKQNFFGFMGYMFFPSLAVALPKIAMTVKLLRSSILVESKKDYVRTAYSRGNSTTQVLYKHVLKNALMPVVTFLGMAFADMIAGSIIVEKVFNIPGIGRILLTGISNRDYPVVEAIIMIIAFIVVLSNCIVDLLYHKLDPRVGKEGL